MQYVWMLCALVGMVAVNRWLWLLLVPFLFLTYLPLFFITYLYISPLTYLPPHISPHIFPPVYLSTDT